MVRVHNNRSLVLFLYNCRNTWCCWIPVLCHIYLHCCRLSQVHIGTGGTIIDYSMMRKKCTKTQVSYGVGVLEEKISLTSDIDNLQKAIKDIHRSTSTNFTPLKYKKTRKAYQNWQVKVFENTWKHFHLISFCPLSGHPPFCLSEGDQTDVYHCDHNLSNVVWRSHHFLRFLIFQLHKN